jgi:uncharacterized 2Fe-2S/4Fe-4S cluster protein (DUF4445 family)
MLTVTIVSPTRSQNVETKGETTFLTLLQRSGWHLPAPCGGAGTCGKCVIHIDPPEAATPPTEKETRLIDTDPTARLACRATPIADVTVTLSADAVPPAQDTAAKGGALAAVEMTTPLVQRRVVELAQPSLGDQRSLADRVRAAVEPETLIVEPWSVSEATTILGSPRVELITTEESENTLRLLQIRTEPEQPLLGVAIDIGTTTVAAYLVDLESGAVLASSSQANAQGTYGADVISRITAAAAGDPLGVAVRSQLHDMTERMIGETGRSLDELCGATIVGNTTMLHLLLDLDAEPISKAPFVPVVTEPLEISFDRIGLADRPEVAAYLAPCVSSYVGADIVADLVSTGMHLKKDLSVLIDIGTNGEIVAGNRDRLVACSTAAGPAFEGATIECGSAGVPGAISHVARSDDKIIIETIEGAAATSICGTGLMDTMALLLSDGIVDETGLLDPDGAPEAYTERFFEHNGEAAFRLSPENAPIPVYVTQSDIRQIQLAKGAIAAGVRVLLDEFGASAESIDRIYLAGGFGTYVRAESALRVGLLPPVAPAVVEPVGNAAGAGAVALLLGSAARNDAARLRSSIEYLELSGLASFQDHYMEQMLFPESSE